MEKGFFITFEGGEGSGKSTQSKILYNELLNKGRDVILTREPGGNKGAEDIRELLVKGDKDRWYPHTELILHMAARSDHLFNLIKPKLETGAIIICDRFFDSTLAYQGYGHMLGAEFVCNINDLLFPNTEPDLTFIFDIEVEKGLARSNKRLNDAQNSENRYELMGIDFHKRVRDGFLAIAANSPKRCHVIDASQDVDIISSQIIDVLRAKSNF